LNRPDLPGFSGVLLHPTSISPSPSLAAVVGESVVAIPLRSTVAASRRREMNRRFAFHAWRRDLGNLALFKYRDFQGFIVSGQNSGTKWLKSMLSLAIAHHFALPPPAFSNNADSNDFIGHPRHQRRYPQTPRP